MKFRDLMNETSVENKQRLCDEIGITMKYLRKLTGGYCLPSLPVANEIMKRYPQIVIQDFIDANESYQERQRERAAAKKKKR